MQPGPRVRARVRGLPAWQPVQRREGQGGVRQEGRPAAHAAQGVQEREEQREVPREAGKDPWGDFQLGRRGGQPDRSLQGRGGAQDARPARERPVGPRRANRLVHRKAEQGRRWGQGPCHRGIYLEALLRSAPGQRSFRDFAAPRAQQGRPPEGLLQRHSQCRPRHGPGCGPSLSPRRVSPLQVLHRGRRGQRLLRPGGRQRRPLRLGARQDALRAREAARRGRHRAHRPAYRGCPQEEGAGTEERGHRPGQAGEMWRGRGVRREAEGAPRL